MSQLWNRDQAQAGKDVGDNEPQRADETLAQTCDVIWVIGRKGTFFYYLEHLRSPRAAGMLWHRPHLVLLPLLHLLYLDCDPSNFLLKHWKFEATDSYVGVDGTFCGSCIVSRHIWVFLVDVCSFSKQKWTRIYRLVWQVQKRAFLNPRLTGSFRGH